MIMVISMYGYGKIFGLLPKHRNRLGRGAVEVPWDEGDGCMKMMFLHLPQKIQVVEMPVRFLQQRIIHRQVGKVCIGVPRALAGRIAKKHYQRCYRRELVTRLIIRVGGRRHRTFGLNACIKE